MLLRRGHKIQGFTLLELSIVLVVIALIVGGILVGRDMIREAEIRKTIAQFENFNTAVNAFKTKYNCLPGDCPNASSFGFDITTNGNGDGIIGMCSYDPNCATNSPSTNHEYVDFWYQLGEAGLIPHQFQTYAAQGGNGSFVPGLAGVATPLAVIKPVLVGTMLGVQTPSGWAVAGDVIFSESCATLIPAWDARTAHNFRLSRFSKLPSGGSGEYAVGDIAAIDRKMDDGLPQSGAAHAWQISCGISSYYVSVAVPGDDVNACVNTETPRKYNIRFPTAKCGLSIKGQF